MTLGRSCLRDMDMGSAIAARAIEPPRTPWCIPGFVEVARVHACKMLR